MLLYSASSLDCNRSEPELYDRTERLKSRRSRSEKDATCQMTRGTRRPRVRDANASIPVIAWNIVAVLINILSVDAYSYFAYNEKAKTES
jgi:hypothetical protein